MSRMAHSVLLSLLWREVVERCGCLDTVLGRGVSRNRHRHLARLLDFLGNNSVFKGKGHEYMCLVLENLYEWLLQSTLEVRGQAWGLELIGSKLSVSSQLGWTGQKFSF